MRLPSIRVQRRWAALAAASLGATAALALLPIFWAQPVNDDFSRAVGGRQLWFADVARDTYLHWSGRWAGVGLEAWVLPRLDPTRYYPLLLGALHLAGLLGLAFFWRLLRGPRAGWRGLALWAAATHALLWSLCPAPGETYYWFTGGVEYYGSLALALIDLALVAAVGQGEPRRWRGTLLLGIGGVLAFILPCVHELAGLSLFLMLLLGLAVAVRERRGIGIWGLAGVLALTGLLVSLLAPGNALRGAQFKNGHSLLITVKSCLKLGVLDVLPWMLQPTLWAATLLLLTRPPARGRPAWLARGVMPWRWVLPGATLLLTLLWLAGPSWAMGGTNGRALNGTQEIFLLGWCASAVAWGRHLGWLRRRLGARRHRALRLAALALLAAAPWLTGNNFRFIREGWALAPRWSRAMRQQQAQARRAHAAGLPGAVLVPIPQPRPFFFFSDGITENPRDWQNESYAAFFGLQSVRTAGSGKP